MNDFLEYLSSVLTFVLGFNVMIFLTDFINLDIEISNYLQIIYIILGIASFVLAIFFKIKNNKVEQEINEIKKKKAEDEANNLFIFRGDYSEEKEEKE